MARIDKQTDKADSKLLPCTFPGCDNEVEVNKFYAPAKARCNDHQGVTSSTVRKMVAVAPKTDAPTVPNHNLSGMCCPVCDEPMDLVIVDQAMGWYTFKCTEGTCLTAVQIKPRWGPLVLSRVPEPLHAAMDEINAYQQDQRTARKITREQVAAEQDAAMRRAAAEAAANAVKEANS